MAASSYACAVASDRGALGGQNNQNRTKADQRVPNSLPPPMGGGGGGIWSGAPPMPIPGMKCIIEGGMKGGGIVGRVGGTAAAARVGGASAKSW